MSNQQEAAKEVLAQAGKLVAKASAIQALTMECAKDGYTRERMAKLFKLTSVPDDIAAKILDTAFKKV